MSDSGYIPEKKREEGDYNSPSDSDEEVTLNGEEEEEDPCRWVILLSGFLAQAISMCTLSSW